MHNLSQGFFKFPIKVSRCGMIYMEPEMLGWRPLLLSWLNTLPKTLKEDNKELIRDLFERMQDALLQFIRKSGFKVHCIDPLD